MFLILLHPLQPLYDDWGLKARDPQLGKGMRLVKPYWLSHRDENRTFEVFSLDASSDGERLVTGGLDSKVKVWSAKGVANPDAEGQPKLLASMAAHTGAVTAVKFSPDNRFIASGSDDRIVLISELDASRQPRVEFGQKQGHPDEQEKEVWTPRKRLVGHDNDVQDLAWSPDGQLLVSVGLDSSIIVWSGTTFEKLNRLDWHNSHVKGVTFDPANKFFVTCSDDRSARIVRYSRASPTELSFSIEAVVQHAFVDSPLTSYFRRCSWSPDGECIACPNATNGPIPTVAIIDRGQWQQQPRHQTSLVGHEGTTEVAKFSPRMYEIANEANSSGNGNATLETCVVATAGEDGSVAVWSTANPRPLVVVRNVATKLITDLAWSTSGLKLYCSSLDGSVVLIEFKDGDLGRVMPQSAPQARLEKYGNATDLMDIPQSVAQVEVQKGAISAKGENESETRNQIGGDASAPSAPSVTSETSNTATIPSKPAPKQVPGEPVPAARAETKTPENSSNTSEPTANVESASTAANVAPVNTAPAANTPAASAPETSGPAPLPSTSAVLKRQKTSVTREGKRRVAPVLMNSAAPPPAPSQQQQHFLSQNRSQLPPNVSPLTWDRPSSALPPGGISTLVVGNKRRADDDPANMGSAGESGSGSRKANKNDDQAYIRPVVLNPSTTVSQLRLATPRVVSHISSDPSGSVVLEARNGVRPSDPSRVQVISRGNVVFYDFVPEFVSLLAGSAEHFWAVASDTGVIYVYTPEGSRALPPLVLGAPISLLESTNQYLCALTATGLIFAWDIASRRALFAPQSVAPCLDVGQRIQDAHPNSGSAANASDSGGNSGSNSNGASGNSSNGGAGSGHTPVNTNAGTGLLRAPQITYCHLSEKGEVVLATSTGSVFHFDTMLQTWQRVCEGFWAYGSRYWDSTASRPMNGPLSLSEQLTNEEALLRAGARGRQLQRLAANRGVQAGYQGFERAVSLSHLSNRIVAAAALRTDREFEHAVLQYVRELSAIGDRLKLSELFRELRHHKSVLERALLVAAEYKGVQTLVAEYR